MEVPEIISGGSRDYMVVHSEFSVLLWFKALVSDLRPGPSCTIRLVAWIKLVHLDIYHTLHFDIYY